MLRDWSPSRPGPTRRSVGPGTGEGGPGGGREAGRVGRAGEPGGGAVGGRRRRTGHRNMGSHPRPGEVGGVLAEVRVRQVWDMWSGSDQDVDLKCHQMVQLYDGRPSD